MEDIDIEPDKENNNNNNKNNKKKCITHPSLSHDSYFKWIREIWQMDSNTF